MLILKFCILHAWQSSFHKHSKLGNVDHIIWTFASVCWHQTTLVCARYSLVHPYPIQFLSIVSVHLSWRISELSWSSLNCVAITNALLLILTVFSLRFRCPEFEETPVVLAINHKKRFGFLQSVVPPLTMRGEGPHDKKTLGSLSFTPSLHVSYQSFRTFRHALLG